MIMKIEWCCSIKVLLEGGVIAYIWWKHEWIDAFLETAKALVNFI